MADAMHRIEREQFVPLSVGEAFAFFAVAFNLEAITPPWLRFRILTPRPIPMSEGTSIEYRLSLHRPAVSLAHPGRTLGAHVLHRRSVYVDGHQARRLRAALVAALRV